ncbi:FAD/NAD(P)-binding protein [Oryzifoliimicrobium ureilyticus]|uniref:FAD/NAD(P)-binding protein n=1 Tax=Oryzifoliimicrobium ureilyticus TaxID=3113724 RepID=UPI00307621C2
MKVRRLFARGGSDGIHQDGLPRIAIVGRGFSGMMMAIALMKQLRTPFHLQLFDPCSSVSGGQALSSLGTSTILNSRVRDLSVSQGETDDFNDWLANNNEFRATVPAAIPGFRQIFVPKQLFSNYVYQRFSEALAQRRDISVRIRQDVAKAIRKQRDASFLLECEAGASIAFDHIVLATGYGISEMRDDGVTETQVRAQRLAARPHIVLLGSGIRVVDRLFQLRDAGFSGQISIVSKHGFLPQSHTPNAAEPIFPKDALPEKLSEIVRFIRNACQTAEDNGQTWQSVMNGLRGHARSLWRDLPADRKRQFNRHLRAIYDSHRNRLPEAMHLRLVRELQQGHTTLVRGTVIRQSVTGVVIRKVRSHTEETLYAERIFDCRCQAPMLESPIIQSLFARKLAAADELGLGIAVDARGKPYLPDGAITEGIFALGPLGLGSLPDIDLVPEIVNQAYAVAEEIDQAIFPRTAAV